MASSLDIRNLLAVTDFFRKEETSNRISSWFIGSKTKISKGDSSFCHEPMKKVCDASFYATGFYQPKGSNPTATAASKAFFKWVTGKSSPWKTITRLGVHPVVTEDGRYCGAVIPGSVIKYENWFTWFNFCVALRAPRENMGHVLFWHLLVKAGMKETDAFYLCRYFRADEKGAITKSFHTNDGGHWALNDVFNNQRTTYTGEKPPVVRSFSWALYRSGKVDECVDSSCQIWMDVDTHGGVYRPFSAIGITGKFVATRFNCVEQYALEDIVKSFYSWQEDMRVLLSKTKKVAVCQEDTSFQPLTPSSNECLKTPREVYLKEPIPGRKQKLLYSSEDMT